MVKKGLLLVFAVSVVLMMVGGRNVFAHFQFDTERKLNTSVWMSDEIQIAAFNDDQYNPSVAYNSNHDEYLVVWHNLHSSGRRDIQAARVSSKGEVIALFNVADNDTYTNEKAQPDVAYDSVNDRYLIVFAYDYYGDGSDWDIHGQFIPWDGPSESLTEFTIDSSSKSSFLPSVAYNPNNQEFVIVHWNHYDLSGDLHNEILGNRIRASDGNGLSDNIIIIINSTVSSSYYVPDIAYNAYRNEYLVVYDDDEDIFGVRYDVEALPLNEITVAAWPGKEIMPAVAACAAGNQYLVVWQAFPEVYNSAIYARFVNGNGTLGDVYLIYDSTDLELAPDVTCSRYGHEFLSTWQTLYYDIYGDLKFGVLGRIVKMDGSMGDLFIITESTNDYTKPAIAAASTDYMVVWEFMREAVPYYQDIYGRIISPHRLFLPTVFRH